MRTRGTTLLELLFTLALMLVVIVVAGGLFTNYSRVSAASDRRDRARRTSEDTLMSFRDDIEAAHELTIAGPSQLDVVRVNHSVAGRMNPAPLGGDWLLQSRNFLMRVEYRMAGDRLVRAIVPATGPRVESVLAYDLRGFQVAPAADPQTLELYTVRLTLPVDRNGQLQYAETSIARMTYLP